MMDLSSPLAHAHTANGPLTKANKCCKKITLATNHQPIYVSMPVHPCCLSISTASMPISPYFETTQGAHQPASRPTSSNHTYRYTPHMLMCRYVVSSYQTRKPLSPILVITCPPRNDGAIPLGTSSHTGRGVWCHRLPHPLTQPASQPHCYINIYDDIVDAGCGATGSPTHRPSQPACPLYVRPHLCVCLGGGGAGWGWGSHTQT